MRRRYKCDAQALADFLIMLWGAMRGDSMRVLRHCDFYVRRFDNIGPNGAVAVCWLQDEGKTNTARPH